MHYRQKITSYLSLPFTVAELLKPYHPDLQGLKRLPWTLIGSFNVNAGEERGGFALKWPQNFLRSVGFLRSKDRPRRIVDGGKATRVAFGARARGGIPTFPDRITGENTLVYLRVRRTEFMQ